MDHSRAPGPLPAPRAEVICTGFPPPPLVGTEKKERKERKKERKKGKKEKSEEK